MLCNVVDVTHLCNFILPSIMRRGDLAIAVSTGGASPALARRIRLAIERVLRRRVRRRAGAARLAARGAEGSAIPSPSDRKILFERIVYSDFMDMVRAGDAERLEAWIERCIDEGPGVRLAERAPRDARGGDARVQAALRAAADRERRRERRDERAARARHLPQDRAGRAARARRAARGPRRERAARARLDRAHPRGGRALDLQPHRAVPRGRRRRRGRDDRARDPRPPGRHPPDRAGLAPLLAAQRATPRATCSASPPDSTR